MIVAALERVLACRSMLVRKGTYTFTGAVIGLLAVCCTPAEDLANTGSGGELVADSGAPNPARHQPDTGMGIYSPEQHSAYDGRFRISATRVYQVGTLGDRAPWDHMGDDGSNLRPVGGTVELDVDEIRNSGTFSAALELPEGRYEVTLDRVVEFSPCQDGGIAAFLYEHGDAGCGDGNWPKSLLYVAGWGIGHATLDGEVLYEDYQIHFMVTQGMRDRDNLRVFSHDGEAAAGAVNPAAQQLDFYIRSPEKNPDNHPQREVFDHFFALEVTWR